MHNLGDKINDAKIVRTSNKYAIKTGMCIDSERAVEALFESNYEELEHIQGILSLEVSIYAMRRISGAFGEVVDSLRHLRRQEIASYQLKYNKRYNDVNENVNF